ncbi:MAG: helix-turn-helix domain-containing protein [Actinobacteria bacterium]|nr:helix-turn-helix domain-containing protein [Actinomycetota bacterium]MSZ04841.1 helix-turn-helix domain-containing protein [Actinomycetota bacterium]MTB06818.1 helix-turn-helix domain-containing protein [Actinomycetota bacterium]
MYGYVTTRITSSTGGSSVGRNGPRYVVRSPEDLGRAIAEIRKSQHLTQAQLAEQGAMSRDSFAHLERGRQGRSIELLLRLLRRLGATVTITVGDRDGAV